VLEGVDVVYLKNVVLKFMEAALAGRVAERDALLPAVATLLQVRAFVCRRTHGLLLVKVELLHM
jgi:hypothetical protein